MTNYITIPISSNMDSQEITNSVKREIDSLRDSDVRGKVNVAQVTIQVYYTPEPYQEEENDKNRD